ncbi:S41 family peptidase [Psychroserpens ponticola]|uniref:S41 family peptidase n=1 Tax=Psychroserpens ponticola TaxID=2932268 RepID=A0ABY7RU21_9FLAO|nr:S41 family peptidase [Psychroserpens ponticola]WCO00607.1 S41 family peptidase [Psychroserpens ponticola]
MKLIKLCLLLAVALTFTNCFEDNDDNAVAASEINDFIWKALNATYLYKADVPDLANNRFSSDGDYGFYLNQFSTPESIFESLLFDRDNVDRFSFLIPNYIDFLENQQGNSLSTGLEFDFYFKPGSDTEVFGIIRLVLPNSVGDNQGLLRGQIFDAVNDVPLSNTNLSDLLNQNSYTLNFANYNDNGTPDDVEDDIIESTANSTSLTKQAYTENPVFQTDVIDVDGENIGYLVYNGFNNNFENELNAAFGQLQASNVQHLVLDLRYNPGGSVGTAAILGSMITGQFNGEVYSKLIYNEDLQQNNSNYKFVNSFDGNQINSLNLSKVYVLTTDASASASELVINSLSQYIDVVQIGDNTVGKTQASITLFDSPGFGPNDINPTHTYALQPLVANSINVNDEAVPSTGLIPDIDINETPRNYGILGDTNEPLLAAALLDIQGLGRYGQFNNEVKSIKKDMNLKPFEDRMYIDIEDVFIDRIQFE